MSNKNLNTAIVYYQAMNDKDISVIEKCVHPEITVTSPLAVVKGKEAALQAIKGFYTLAQNITIRAKFSSDDQVMLAIDVIFPNPIGLFRASSLLTFSESLIKQVELFYDARPLENNKDNIFSQN